MLKLYNSLTRRVEEFQPLNPPKVGMYTCGPTVYGPSHIGHARSYVAFDILKRILIFDDYKVTHVMNITDVHDDIIKKASQLHLSINELSNKYIQVLHQDLKSLNCIPANYFPRVTENMEGIIEMIKALINKGYAYIESDGSVYYKVSKFKPYGKLSGIKFKKSITGTRVTADKYEKEQAYDFALWKGTKEGETWDSPWCKGRPGWHIECSVMSKKYLGETFDIHAGGVDIKFPHHENEIAQSEAVNGKKFVNYWFHPGLLDVERTKMSRSLGNVHSLEDLKNKGYSALDFRYLTYLTHYRQRMNFTWNALETAKISREKLASMIAELSNQRTVQGAIRSVLSNEKLQKIERYGKEFYVAVNDDLNMPQALAVAWEVVKSNVPSIDKYELLLEFDNILGLGLKNVHLAKENVQIPEKIWDLVKKRNLLRSQEKWEEADSLRQQIEEDGFLLEDSIDGTKIIAKD